jgi:hypothetical protein
MALTSCCAISYLLWKDAVAHRSPTITAIIMSTVWQFFLDINSFHYVIYRFESCWPAMAKDTSGVILVFNPEQSSHIRDLDSWLVKLFKQLNVVI